ncbi:uncharacterized protein LOC112888804 [Panicum hallii]|uniref:uncharacterized protein LOC112888804 n=1 Tax=Panicum hallii TaxID=206008 RepID=UPI000DF4EB0D|nr:uncharacterized protein LOC112888804 [Panicum hallii]XP_025810923.1 uncharacterized protein LOC112888804 [Panicum hallii]
MSRRASAARDRCLELERAIAGRVRSGSLGLDDAVKMFDELLPHARPASVRAFNQLLTAVSRAQGRDSSSSELVPSLFNRMARACADKVGHASHGISSIYSEQFSGEVRWIVPSPSLLKRVNHLTCCQSSCNQSLSPLR